MLAILPIIAQLLPIIAQLPGDISALFAWIASVRQAAQQSGEWTPELEAAFLANLQLLAKAPEQQPDPVQGAPLALTAAQQDQAENAARADSAQFNPFERAR
jgi:hypothetical protein